MSNILFLMSHRRSFLKLGIQSIHEERLLNLYAHSTKTHTVNKHPTTRRFKHQRSALELDLGEIKIQAKKTSYKEKNLLRQFQNSPDNKNP